jgi:hypothetical protein
MKAVVLHEYGGPDKLRYEDWDDPQAGDGQIFVRVSAAGVSQSHRLEDSQRRDEDFHASGTAHHPRLRLRWRRSLSWQGRRGLCLGRQGLRARRQVLRRTPSG